jgi:CBS-domain-containing membrane protein
MPADSQAGVTMTNTGLGTLVTYNPAWILADDLVHDLVDRFVDAPFHHWPVVDGEQRVVGVLSDEDVVRVLASAWTVDTAETRLRTRVSDVVSAEPITAKLDDSPRRILDFFLSHNIHSMPVIDDNRLVGIVTSSDFMRELSYGSSPLGSDPVSKWMIKSENSVDHDDTLDVARGEMLAASMSYIPVMRGACPLGVISQRNLRRAKCRQLMTELLEREFDEQSTTVLNLVKTAPTIRPGERLAKAAELMADFRVQAVAVVAHGPRLVGVLSEDDILRAIQQETHNEAVATR